MKLFTIMQKNFKIFMRSKFSALIIFLGPLLLVSLIGMSFSNTQLPGLSVGVYSPNYNDFTNSILEKISENKFTINKYETKELCSDSVKKGEESICLLFPANMDKTNNEVTFVVDYSKMNLVWVVLDVFSTKVSERATELRYDYAKDLLSRVEDTKKDLASQKTALDSLKIEADESKTSLDSAKSGIEGISADSNIVTITADEAQTSLSAVADKFNDAEDSVDEAIGDVEGSSLSDTEKEAIIESLDDASSALSTAAVYLEGNSSTKSLEYMILALQDSIESAQAQLESIKKQKAMVKSDLVVVEEGLIQTQKTVSDLISSVASASSRIENVKSSDAEQLVSPIRTKIEAVTTKETHFNYLFPTLIVLIIMITAILLSSTLVMTERKSRSVFRNFITPTSSLIFNIGTFLTALVAILAQLIIFLAVSSLFFQTNIISSMGNASLVFVLVISVFIMLGMVIGYLFKSEETYVLASVTVAALLMFLSSTIMPIESISDTLRAIASYTPFVVSENALRQVLIFNFGIADVIIELLVLLGYMAVFFAAIIGIEKLYRHTITIKKKDIKK